MPQSNETSSFTRADEVLRNIDDSRHAFLREGIILMASERLLPESLKVEPVIEGAKITTGRTRLGRGSFTNIWPTVSRYRNDLLAFFSKESEGLYPAAAEIALTDVVMANPNMPYTEVIGEWVPMWHDALAEDGLSHVRSQIILSQDKVGSPYVEAYPIMRDKTLLSSAAHRMLVGRLFNSDVLADDERFLSSAEILTHGVTAGTDLYQETVVRNLTTD